MDVRDAIRSRRTVHDFDLTKPVDPADLEAALESGIWAQNHKKTNPWRFTIAGPETRAAIANIMLAAAPDPVGDASIAMRQKLEKKAEKTRALPALVVVSMIRTPGDDFREREDYAAVSGAIQNIALDLWANGIGLQWGTGAVTRAQQTYEACGIDPAAEEIVAFLKIGYPADIRTQTRTPLPDITRTRP